MNFVFKNNKEIMFVVLFLCSGLNASPQGVSSLFDDSTNLLGADSSFAFLQEEEPVEVEVSSLFDDPDNLLGADGKTDLKPVFMTEREKFFNEYLHPLASDIPDEDLVYGAKIYFDDNLVGLKEALRCISPEEQKDFLLNKIGLKDPLYVQQQAAKREIKYPLASDIADEDLVYASERWARPMDQLKEGLQSMPTEKQKAFLANEIAYLKAMDAAKAKDASSESAPTSASVYDKSLHTQDYSDLNPAAGSTYDPVKNNAADNQEVRLLRAEVGNLRKQFEAMILATKGL